MVNFWKNRKVFVTGASGLLGSRLTKDLISLGADVVCLVRDWTPNSELIQSGEIKNVTVVSGDLSDVYNLERIINEHEIKTVFHLAAQTIVGIANSNPLSTWESNIKGTWNVLEACRRNSNVSEIVIASSDKAYGDQESLPYTEDAPLSGVNPYDCSKSCADMIGTSYAKTFNLPVVTTRCGNLFGEGDLNWNRIIPSTIRDVYNNTIPTIRSDGSFIRDYFYVNDASLAYIKLAEALSENRDLSGEAFNFSNELQITVLELVNKILVLMGKEDVKPTILNQAKNEIKHQYLSAEKARRVLGWTPKFKLEEALKETIDWYTSFLEKQDD